MRGFGQKFYKIDEIHRAVGLALVGSADEYGVSGKFAATW